MDINAKTTEALTACREALHAVEFEAHLRRRELNTVQAVARYTVKKALRDLITTIEAERDIQPDNAESNATKRFLQEQRSLCNCAIPAACPFCRVVDGMLGKLGYETPVIPASEPSVEGTRTVADGPRRLALVGVEGGLCGHEGRRS